MHYCSDGAGSQFKNRFNLASVLYHPLDYGTQSTWSFSETAHGKGAVDGVGGAVKLMLSGEQFYKAVLS